MPANWALLALGANIRAEENLPEAVRLLGSYGTIRAVSRVWQSAPVDFSYQPDFLNAAVLLETKRSAEEIMSSVIPAIENALQRRRDPHNKNAPRTIDVDLAMFNDLHATILGHEIPDPQILTRPFLAVPLADVAPKLVHPVTGESLEQIAEQLRGPSLTQRKDIELQQHLYSTPLHTRTTRKLVPMAYSVKEIYFTLQGEGAQTGRAAVFCRFAGCNLWSGRDDDRATAVCNFCDTDFVGTDGPGGGRFADATDLAAAIVSAWRPAVSLRARPLVVFTGGEPLLQLDQAIVDHLHARGFEIAIETNGTLQPPAGIDWICVSPKADAPCILHSGDELKLVFPQRQLTPDQFSDWSFRFFFLQPMYGPDLATNTQLAVEYCLAHPQWRLSLQTHKLVGLP